MVTNALAGQGKSTGSANLARMMAQTSTPVLLVDADLRPPTSDVRRPMMNTTFEIDGAVGLTQVLAGDLAVEEVIIESGMANLILLPAGCIPPT